MKITALEHWIITIKELLFIILVSTIFVLNSRFEVFEYENIYGLLGTVISVLYLPAFVIAIFVTQKADPPGLIGLCIGGAIQTYIMWVSVKYLYKIASKNKSTASNN